MTLQPRTQSLQAFYPSDQKTWRVWVRDWWHREASAEGTQVKNQRWSTRISLAHFCTFQISLNLIIDCVYSEDLELVYHSAIEFKCPWQIGMSIGLNGIILIFISLFTTASDIKTGWQNLPPITKTNTCKQIFLCDSSLLTPIYTFHKIKLLFDWILF